MIVGIDPITLDEYDIREWLIMDPNNLILKLNYSDYTESEIFLINKNILEIPNLKNIFNKCVYNQGIFLPKETYKSKINFINIGYLIGKKCLIPEKEINNILKKKKRVLNLNITNKESNYISREYLLLQYIGLYKQHINKTDNPKIKKEKQDYNKNIPYKIDVYFEKILADALLDYSYTWDAPINYYLREGESYFDSDIFRDYQYRYGSTRKSSIKNIKNKIKSLDRVFLEAAPRNEDVESFYWRGMKTPFNNFNNINDQHIVQNFLSLSSNYSIAVKFSGIPHNSTCCLYKFFVDKGVPYINMVNTTKYKYEKEILLPRNLTITIINKEFIKYNISDQNYTPIYIVRVSLNNITDYRINNMCYNYLNANLSVNSDINLKNYIEHKSVIENPKKTIKIVKIIKDKNKKKIQKRCPNGTRRNKKSGLCEPNIILNKPTPPEKGVLFKKEKKPRCPNKTRRNKKTGLCEPT